MNMTDAGGGAMPCASTYQLVYAPVRGGGGSSFAFPCDAVGLVELNSLSDRARDNYLLARALVGRDFLPPKVVRTSAGTTAATQDPR